MPDGPTKYRLYYNNELRISDVTEHEILEFFDRTPDLSLSDALEGCSYRMEPMKGRTPFIPHDADELVAIKHFDGHQHRLYHNPRQHLFIVVTDIAGDFARDVTKYADKKRACLQFKCLGGSLTIPGDITSLGISRLFLFSHGPSGPD